MLKRIASPAWAVLEYGWFPLLLLATTPWFLHRLGSEYYGYWMLLTATTGFGGALNAGTGAATIKAISSGRGRGQGAQDQVRASLGIALIGGGALALLVFLAYWFAGDLLLGRMGQDVALVRLTGAAAALLIWLEQLDNVASSSMKGVEQFGSAARLEIIGKTAQVALAAVATWYSPTLGTLYLALLAGALVRLCAKATVARQLLDMTSLRPSLRGVADLLQFARWGWLQGIGSVLFGVADRMIVGSLLGASSLAYYSIASQLAMQVHAISAAGLSVIFPLVSRRLEATGRITLWPMVRLTMSGNLLLSSLLALALLTLSPLILDPWVGVEAAAVVRDLLPWLVGAYWLLALNVAPYYILLGMGRMRFVGLTVLAAGAAGVIALPLAMAEFGLPGAPAGRGVYALVSLTLLVPVALQLLRERRELSRLRETSTSTFNREPLP